MDLTESGESGEKANVESTTIVLTIRRSGVLGVVPRVWLVILAAGTPLL